MIYGIVKNQKLDLRAQAAADTIDYLTAKFSFLSSDWEGLVKYAHFRQGTNVFSVQLIDDKIDEIDHLNLAKGEWEVYLHGNEYKNGEVKKRITTNIATFTVEPTGALNGEPFPEVEPSVVEQIEADVEDHEERITALEEAGGGDVVKDVIQDGKSLVNEEKIAVLPKKAQSIELVNNEQTMVLKYNPTDIIEMWGNSLALTFKNNVIVRVESFGARGADFYYIAKSNNKIALLFARYTGINSPQVYDILSGIFSDVNFTQTEKTKLAEIEAGAEVNLVNDVQDTEGNSLVSEGIATIPAEGQGIKVVNGDGTLKYSGSEILSMFQEGKDIRHKSGEIIVYVELTGSVPPLYKISYLQRDNYSPYGICLYYDTVNASSEFVDRRVFAGRFSQESFTSAEKTKLNNIEDYAEVNDVTDVQDSDGNSLVQGKIATIPPIPVLPTLADVATTGDYEDLINTPTIPDAQIQSDWSQTDTDALDYIKNKPTIPSAQIQSDYAQSNSSAVDYIKNKPNLATVATSGSYNDLSNTPTIPTAGTIASGNQGYATGGDVYSVVGNVEAVLAELIGGNA